MPFRQFFIFIVVAFVQNVHIHTCLYIYIYIYILRPSIFYDFVHMRWHQFAVCLEML